MNWCVADDMEINLSTSELKCNGCGHIYYGLDDYNQALGRDLYPKKPYNTNNMRIIILLNPNKELPIEHCIKGKQYAEASYGFDVTSLKDVHDHSGLAKILRDAANVLDAPTIPDIPE